MNLPGRRIGVIVIAFSVSTGVWSQGNSNTMPAPVLVLDPCKRDVLRHQANIDFVRKTLGDKAATELDAKFLSKDEWDALLLKDGYCGISDRLREKRLIK
jgi:hypothetical protein